MKQRQQRCRQEWLVHQSLPERKIKKNSRQYEGKKSEINLASIFSSNVELSSTEHTVFDSTVVVLSVVASFVVNDFSSNTVKLSWVARSFL